MLGKMPWDLWGSGYFFAASAGLQPYLILGQVSLHFEAAKSTLPMLPPVAGPATALPWSGCVQCCLMSTHCFCTTMSQKMLHVLRAKSR